MSGLAPTVVMMLTTLKQLRGKAAIYKRANGHEIALTLVPAKRTTNVSTVNGRLTFQTEDWLILAANLLDEDVPFLPERRETITVDDVVYEVLPDRNLPQWEYFDTARMAMRIRTLVIS